MHPAHPFATICLALSLSACHSARNFSLPGTTFRLVTRNQPDGAKPSMLLPPPIVHQAQQPLSFTIPLTVGSTARTKPADCRISNDLFDLQILARPTTQATLLLPPIEKWEAMLSYWDQPDNQLVESRFEELLAAPELLEQRKCLPPSSALQLRQLLRETIPMRPAHSLYGAYGHRAGSSALDLRPGLRLKIVRAHFRLPPEKRKSVADGYLGLSNANFDLQEDASGKLSFRLAELTFAPASLQQSLPAPLEDLLFAKAAPARPFYRFLMLTHYLRSGTKRSAIVLGAGSLGALRAMESKLRNNPGEPCTTLTTDAKDVCVSFEGEVTVSPELHVIANGQPQIVPWGATVRSLLQQAKAPAGSTIQLRRSWENQLRPVQLEGDPAALLSLVLVGGDELSWSPPKNLP